MSKKSLRQGKPVLNPLDRIKLRVAQRVGVAHQILWDRAVAKAGSPQAAIDNIPGAAEAFATVKKMAGICRSHGIISFNKDETRR